MESLWRWCWWRIESGLFKLENINDYYETYHLDFDLIICNPHVSTSFADLSSIILLVQHSEVLIAIQRDRLV